MPQNVFNSLKINSWKTVAKWIRNAVFKGLFNIIKGCFTLIYTDTRKNDFSLLSGKDIVMNGN